MLTTVDEDQIKDYLETKTFVFQEGLFQIDEEGNFMPVELAEFYKFELSCTECGSGYVHIPN